MRVTIGEKGLQKSWQNKFPKETKCCRCEGKARIGFVAHEGTFGEYRKIKGAKEKFVYDLHKSTGAKGGLWLHDACAVAVYFCKDCLETTALYNQA